MFFYDIIKMVIIVKILKYQKTSKNIYKVYIDDKSYLLYDDLIIKYELLLKKEISSKQLKSILQENDLLKAYYEALKSLNVRIRCAQELQAILNKKGYSQDAITYVISRLTKEGYLNNHIYIEAFIHDALTLKTMGERKIIAELKRLGFELEEIFNHTSQIDHQLYLNKIQKYITKKLKSNHKSIRDFKQQILNDLEQKGFDKNDILNILDTYDLEDNLEQLAKLINKQYNKYIKKYDDKTTRLKVKSYLYNKGYYNINIDEYIKKA